MVVSLENIRKDIRMRNESDKQMSKIESARCWALWSLEIAKNDPASLGIPKPLDWSWPPHDRASNAKAWPAGAEEIYNGLK